MMGFRSDLHFFVLFSKLSSLSMHSFHHKKNIYLCVKEHKTKMISCVNNEGSFSYRMFVEMLFA